MPTKVLLQQGVLQAENYTALLQNPNSHQPIPFCRVCEGLAKKIGMGVVHTTLSIYYYTRVGWGYSRRSPCSEVPEGVLGGKGGDLEDD